MVSFVQFRIGPQVPFIRPFIVLRTVKTSYFPSTGSLHPSSLCKSGSLLRSFVVLSTCGQYRILTVRPVVIPLPYSFLWPISLFLFLSVLSRKCGTFIRNYNGRSSSFSKPKKFTSALSHSKSKIYLVTSSFNLVSKLLPFWLGCLLNLPKPLSDLFFTPSIFDFTDQDWDPTYLMPVKEVNKKDLRPHFRPVFLILSINLETMYTSSST